MWTLRVPLLSPVVGFGRSGFNVRQLWNDQYWFRQVSRYVTWVRLPGDALQQSVIVSLLFWDSSHGLNNSGPSLVHDNALCCFHSDTHKHTSRPPRLQLMSSALSVVCALNKAWAFQLSRACLSNACRLCDHRRVHPCDREGED